MKSRTWMLGSIFSLVAVLLVATSTVYAAPIIVDCSKGGSISSTLASLVKAGNTRGITISVRGTCKENIVIGAFDHLVLQAVSGIATTTTLQDASNGTAAVVLVFSSYDVTLQGFTINGGSAGVQCLQFSYCSLYLNTIQQSGGQEGVRISRSNAILEDNRIVNHAGRGITVANGGQLFTGSDTISDNQGDAGIVVNFGGSLSAVADTIKNNQVGITAVHNSVVRVIDTTISDNNGDGVRLAAGTTASFEQASTGNVITGNAGNGVSINDLSFASFGGENNVSMNLTQPDVACYQQYSATRGAGSIGGTTNCAEPQQKK